MKKVFIMAAAIALTLASCGSKTQGNAAGTDSAAAENTAESAEATADGESAGEAADEAALTEDSKATVTHLTGELQKAIAAKDSKATITTLANLQTIYKNLVAEGKLDEAKAYGSAIKKFVSENAESLKNVAEGNVTILQLIEGVSNLPTTASTTAEQAKAAINSDIVNLASPAIAKGETAVKTAEAAAEAVKNAPAAAKAAATTAANKAVSAAKTAAENKVNSEVQKANDKTNAAATAAKAKAESKVNEARQKANDAVNKAADKAIKDLLK